MLAIGGSDSSGGAGIQADIKTGAALGVDVSTAITAITARNSLGVHAIEPVPPEILRAQLVSVCSDLQPNAVKLGMLYDVERLRIVAEVIESYQLENIVCDPVLASTSGTTLLDGEGREYLDSMLPSFTLFTPNAVETATLTGLEIHDSADLLKAGRVLVERGAKAVLLKGGHLSGNDATDLLIQKDSSDPVFFPRLRIDTRNDHGTGCVLASAIACGLATGVKLSQAVAAGCEFVYSALQQSTHLSNGSGRGSLNLLFERT